MPLIEAAGTSVDKISPDSVKNSTPPERIWLSVSVSEPSWLLGKICRPTVGFLFDSRRHLPRPRVSSVCFWTVVRVFVDPLRLLRASDARGGWSQNRQARAGEQTAPGDCGF
jgi:hypothetical protein